MIIMIDFNDLVLGFKELGLKEGDIILVHSSFKSFGGVEGGPQTVINAFLDILGSEGTLIMPTFTFKFCEEYNETGDGYFDVDNTPSEMGILTEIVRKMPGAKRSVNPIYSVAVYGKKVNYLASVNDKNVFDKNSIFGRLTELDAKIMIIGLSYTNSWTYVHHVEEMEGIDYRYHKDFSGTIVVDGKKYKDTFTMLVRDIERGVQTAVDPMGEILEKRGAVKIKKIGQSSIKLMLSTKQVYKITAEMLKKNPKLFYEIEPQ